MHTEFEERKDKKRQATINNIADNIFITSDTHFNHTSILKYEDRPFETVEKMDEEMIKRWNNVVSKYDKVFHLGDFAFANREKTREYVEQLNGYKILIMGNHDKRKSIKFYLDVGFDEVSKHPIIYKEWYILSHHPIYINENMPHINLHGHTHKMRNPRVNNTRDGDGHINVCVENWEYTPQRLKVVLDKCVIEQQQKP